MPQTAGTEGSATLVLWVVRCPRWTLFCSFGLHCLSCCTLDCLWSLQSNTTWVRWEILLLLYMRAVVDPMYEGVHYYFRSDCSATHLLFLLLLSLTTGWALEQSLYWFNRESEREIKYLTSISAPLHLNVMAPTTPSQQTLCYSASICLALTSSLEGERKCI